MNRARLGQGFVALALLGGCAASPSSSDLYSDSIVLTKHAPEADFKEYKTYYLRPQIRTVGDDGELAPVDDAKAEKLLDATSQNLQARGYVATSKDKADLGVELLYTEHVSTTYWCYGWYDPWYWGYPYYPYYPYYGCDGAMWKSNMLSTSIADLKTARDNPGTGGGEAGAGGQGSGPSVDGIWFSGVYGIALNSQQAVDGINTAFKQSPYIKAAP